MRVTVSITHRDFELLRTYIEGQCGIALGDEKAYLVESRLAGLLVETGCPDYGALYDRVRATEDTHLRDRIVDAMTTNETQWFRDRHPFTILAERLLPAAAEALRAGRLSRVRIWSGACSTGQEPYSIAITIQEFLRRHPEAGLRGEHVEILATDISPSALFIARTGRYDANALSRGLPEEYLPRYFRAEEAAWVLEEAIRRMVVFRKFNLQDPLEPLGRFDVVFLRNVTIYFAEPSKRRIYGGIARLLAGGGHLIISAAESLQGISQDFQPLTHAGGVYYRCLA